MICSCNSNRAGLTSADPQGFTGYAPSAGNAGAADLVGSSEAMSSPGDGSRSDRGPPGAMSGTSGVQAPAPQGEGDIRYVSSAELFAGAREVVIQHEHHRYRLKITSKGGMILNK
jgi:hemin uptake protein HemP